MMKIVGKLVGFGFILMASDRRRLFAERPSWTRLYQAVWDSKIQSRLHAAIIGRCGNWNAVCVQPQFCGDALRAPGGWSQLGFTPNLLQTIHTRLGPFAVSLGIPL
ncbi:hypothetical protein [Novipirellula maiorica]|nr:hypothetical protein [Rhodopirellula maiorica]